MLSGSTTDPAGPAYSSDEMLDKIGELFGQERADEIRNSGVGIVEIDLPDDRSGLHDRDTLGVNTRPPTGSGGSAPTMPLVNAALVLEHEFRHARVCGNALFDPDTREGGWKPQGYNPGACNHARMHFDQVLEVLGKNCPENMTPDLCLALANDMANGQLHARNCKAGGGFPPDDWPAASELAECCGF